MEKFYLSAKSFNNLKRDPAGAKVQRVWTCEFRGLGVDLGKTKKSIIYKFKSPVTGKFRILSLDSYSYSQKMDEDLMDRIVGDHYQVKDKIRAGIDPLEEKDPAREERKQKKAEAEQVEAVRLEQEKTNAYTLNRAFDAYTKNRLFTEDISAGTRAAYLGGYNRHIAPKLVKKPLASIKPTEIYSFLDGLGDSACNMSIVILQRIQKVAIRSGKISAPFCFDVDKRTVGKRTRMIEDLPIFLAWLQDNEQYQSYKNAIYSQLLYGTRANEIRLEMELGRF